MCIVVSTRLLMTKWNVAKNICKTKHVLVFVIYMYVNTCVMICMAPIPIWCGTMINPMATSLRRGRGW